MEPEAETETGTESESMREWRLLAFLYNPGTTYLSKGGSTHSGLGPPKPIMNQESSTGAPQACLQTSLIEAFSQLKFLFLDSNLCKQTNQDKITLDIHTNYVGLLDKGVPMWGMVRC